MRNFADRILNAAKRFFGVHSPSKDCEAAAHIPSWEEINAGTTSATASATSNFQNLQAAAVGFVEVDIPKKECRGPMNAQSILYAGGVFLGFNETQVLFSDNGIDWEATIDIEHSGKPLFLSYDGELYTAVVCENGNVYAYHSRNGYEWIVIKELHGTRIHFAHKKEAEALASILSGWESTIVRTRRGGAWVKGWTFMAKPLDFCRT